MKGDQEEIPENSTRKYKLPPGYRFLPTDVEVISYLQRKIRNEPLLIEEMKDVEFDKSGPKTLTETCPELGEKIWYFFTSRNRKYPNGSRPDRTVDGGYWKATEADKNVYHEGKVVGYKKTLVFYEGKHQDSGKTNWIMHEFRVDQVNQSPGNKRKANDMKLDWVLCRIYKNTSRQKRNQQEDERGDRVNEASSSHEVEVNNQTLNNVNPEREKTVALEITPAVDNDVSLQALEFEMGLLINFGDSQPPCLDDVLNTQNPQYSYER